MLGALFCIELISLLTPYDLAGRRGDRGIAEAFNTAVLGAYELVLCGAGVFAMAAWPRRMEFVADWSAQARVWRWRPWAAFSVIIALALFVFTLALKESSASRAWPIWLLVVPWLCGVFIMIAAFLLSAAPLSFWATLFRSWRFEIATTGIGLAAITALSTVASDSWSRLSGATFALSHWILAHYETGVSVDTDHRVIQVGNFAVEISPQCSGYEGVGLVTGFLALYCITFRRQLRFPNALLLLPIGAAAIWVLNAFRIAFLVSFGAHISPSIAVHGFHSGAGWLAFLGVTLALIVGAHRMTFFHIGAAKKLTVANEAAVRLATALLLPLAASLALHATISTFSADGRWAYAAEPLLLGMIFWHWRNVYRSLIHKVSWLSVVAGIIIGLVWALTDRGRAAPSPTELWISSLSPTNAAFWIALRVFAFAIFTPIAEELAFRGYLPRALSSSRFETLPPGQITWLSIGVSTLLFAAMHQRWLAAFLAGAVYALLLRRTNRISDAVASHAASNATIAAIAFLNGQWALL